MNLQEKNQLLKMLQLLYLQIEQLYEQGPPVPDTGYCEGKIQQMKDVLTVLNIDFED